MKKLLTIAILGGLFAATTSQAQVTIRICGSTAFRANAVRAITNLFGGNITALAAGAVGDVHAFERYVEALAAVKPEDVARVAKLLTPAHRSVVSLVPGGESPPAGEKPKPSAAAAAGAAKGGAK